MGRICRKGRASSPSKLSDEVLAWSSVLSKVQIQIVCLWPNWCHSFTDTIISYFIKSRYFCSYESEPSRILQTTRGETLQRLSFFVLIASLVMYLCALPCFPLMHISNICLGTPRVSSERGFESVQYETHGLPRHFWWIHLIGLIWTTEFIFACQQFVIAGTVAVWYFTRYVKLNF